MERHRMTRITRRAALAAGLAASAAPAFAAFPERPIRWLVGYPPGGGTDVLARLLGQSMGARLGVPVVIENRPGAATNIAAEAAAQAAPDGTTPSSPRGTRRWSSTRRSTSGCPSMPIPGCGRSG